MGPSAFEYYKVEVKEWVAGFFIECNQRIEGYKSYRINLGRHALSNFYRTFDIILEITQKCYKIDSLLWFFLFVFF